MNIDFCKIGRFQLPKADFPLNHDCILKVQFKTGCPMNYAYYSTRSQDSGILTLIFQSIPLVSRVFVSSVEDLPDDF